MSNKLPPEVQRYFRLKQQASRGGVSPKTELENLQVLAAWRDGNTNSEQAAAFIGVNAEDIGSLWSEAVKSGKELVR